MISTEWGEQWARGGWKEDQKVKKRMSEAQRKKGKEREIGRRRTGGNVACCGGDWRPLPRHSRAIWHSQGQRPLFILSLFTGNYKMWVVLIISKTLSAAPHPLSESTTYMLINFWPLTAHHSCACMCIHLQGQLNSAGVLTCGGLAVVGQCSPAVLLLEQGPQNLMAHLPLLPQGYVRGHHLIVRVQVVTANITNTLRPVHIQCWNYKLQHYHDNCCSQRCTTDLIAIIRSHWDKLTFKNKQTKRV